jgi:hypothetical protein
MAKMEHIIHTKAVLNHHLSQKLKPLRNNELNHLIYIIILSLVCGHKLYLKKRGPTHENFK